MKRLFLALFAGVLAVVMSLGAGLAAVAGQQTPASPPTGRFGDKAKPAKDGLPNPRADKQAKQRALGKQIS